MTDWTDEQIEALCQAATPGPWTVDAGSWGVGNAEFIAAARELVPSLLARAQQAEAGEDDLRRLLLDETYRPEGGEIVMRELDAARSERDAERRRADHNAHAVNENADMIVRLRAELVEAKAENDELHQLIWKQGQLLTGAANALRGEPPALTTWSHHDVAERARQVVAERDRLAAQVAAVRALHRPYQRSAPMIPWGQIEWCRVCDAPAPCPTIRALDGAMQDGEIR